MWHYIQISINQKIDVLEEEEDRKRATYMYIILVLDFKTIKCTV
jgi:hypothetical protein